MKKVFFVLALCLLMAGCGSLGAPHKDSDVVMAEKDELKEENKELDVIQTEESQAAETETVENSSNKIESDNVVIDQFEYEYDSENTVLVAINESISTGEISVYSSGKYSNGNEFLLINDFVNIFTYPFAKEIDMTYAPTIDGDTYIYLTSGGNLLMNTIPENYQEYISKIPDEYVAKIEDFTEKIRDFYVKHGIADALKKE